MTLKVGSNRQNRTKGRTPKQDAASKVNDLPNTYKFAAEALKTMSERGGSVGSIVVSKYKSYNYKHIYALVMNCVKNIRIVKKIIHETKLAKKIPVSNPFLLEILVGDLLYGRGLKSVEQNTVAASILIHKESIIKQEGLLKKNFSTQQTDSSVKYLRINSIKSTMDTVISQLKAIGLTQLEYSKDKIKFKKFINKFKSMEDNQFMIDFHFPDELIVLKPLGAEKLKKTDLFKKGKAMLQDKASFMAVEAMEVSRGQKIIDACFAPGGKTSLIASKMKNNGKIYSFDVDKKRCLAAKHLLKIYGVNCCKPEVMDFSKVKLRRLLSVNRLDCIDCIIIDPSCSGSGIKTRLDYKPTSEEKGRLKKLQAFQVSLLKHALKSGISKSIVYCTCSTSVEENEEALEMALNESGTRSKWKFVDVLPYWPNRGEDSFEFGKKCLRSDETNLTNGFFIAKLEQINQDFSHLKDKSNGDKNESNEDEVEHPDEDENDNTDDDDKEEEEDDDDDDDDDEEDSNEG